MKKSARPESSAHQGLSNEYVVMLDRDARVTDEFVIDDATRNPRWFSYGSRGMDSTQSDADFARELYAGYTTARLEAILESPYLLIVDGQMISAILAERAANGVVRTATTERQHQPHDSISSPSLRKSA